MSKKLRVAVLFGGKSGEHDVSLSSAASVMQAIDKERFSVTPIGITKQGEWLWDPRESLQMFRDRMNEQEFAQLHSNSMMDFLPDTKQKNPIMADQIMENIDVVFPVLHGPYGEDGTIQGFLEIVNTPYVGAGVLASAVGMDKVISKNLLQQEGIPQGKFICIYKYNFQANKDWIEQVESSFNYPCFVKPANLGSSVGISKANDLNSLQSALQLAFKYDRKAIVEEFIPAREIEVAVLGHNEVEVSIPGEIISCNDFYDYSAKYIDGKSKMQIPAQLTTEEEEKIRDLAKKTYQTIDCSGMARVDFFIHKRSGKILVNEINTIPGFTPYSMYPIMWQHSGLSYSDLISKLIDIGIERFKEKQELITSLK